MYPLTTTLANHSRFLQRAQGKIAMAQGMSAPWSWIQNLRIEWKGKMEDDMETGFYCRIVENHMDKNMEDAMYLFVFWGRVGSQW